MEFVDRLLKCADCGNDFVFTAGEQLFFFDKQFKNDPKRCKLCKAKRAGLGRTAATAGAAVALPLSRTETRTSCSACGVETTVPFRPTQGRPVLCRSCFQLKRVPAVPGAAPEAPSPAVEAAILAAPANVQAAIAMQTLSTVPDTAPAAIASVQPTAGVTAIAEAPAAVLAEAAAAQSDLVALAADAPSA